jgi:hypothetical protein
MRWNQVDVPVLGTLGTDALAGESLPCVLTVNLRGCDRSAALYGHRCVAAVCRALPSSTVPGNVLGTSLP